MTIFGRPITQDDMDNIASYMDDEIREKLHGQIAPCSPEEFIWAYIREDPSFEDLLEQEFNFDADGIEIFRGEVVRFFYDDLEFFFTVYGEDIEVYADDEYQFGITLGEYGIETDTDVIRLIIENYNNGNIIIDN